MLKKTYDLLKNNPVIILFYALVSSNFLGIGYLHYFMNLNYYVSEFLIIVILLLLCTGLGNMIKESLQNARTVPKSFISGIKKYSIHVFLSFLLLYVFYFLFRVIQVIILIPFIFLDFIWNPIVSDIAAIIIVNISTILIIPFVVLLPTSIIIDDTDVIQGLINSLKAGAENYLRLLFVAIVFYTPTVIFEIIYKLIHLTG